MISANVNGQDMHIACMEADESTLEIDFHDKPKPGKCARCNVPLDQVPDP